MRLIQAAIDIRCRLMTFPLSFAPSLFQSGGREGGREGGRAPGREKEGGKEAKRQRELMAKVTQLIFCRDCLRIIIVGIDQSRHFGKEKERKQKTKQKRKHPAVTSAVVSTSAAGE